MQTRTLYYENPYQKSCNMTVLSCLPAGKQFHVVTDQTIFYPEGGGQPADHGTIGSSMVLDVQIIGDTLVHIVSDPLVEGSVVEGKLDWKRRFDLMQQHSGEHIVSGMIHQKFGYDNVGFHMGRDFLTIDLSGPLDEEQLRQVEEEVNSYIWSDQESQIHILTQEEKETLTYRSKKELEGEVRLVEFPGADVCACCGLHVARSGEIGFVKLLTVKRFHEGVRIEMLCGRKALVYLNIQEKQNREVAAALSAKPEAAFQAVQKLSQELYDLRGQMNRMRDANFRKQAVFLQGEKDVMIEEPDLSPVDLRKCTDIYMRHCQGICCVISGNDRDGYKYAIGHKERKIKEFVKEVNEALQGRGGGKDNFAQGSLSCHKDAICAFFRDKGFQVMQ